MLPEFIPPDVVHGERKVFKMLRDDPGASGWLVLHSLDLAKHISQTQGEADFVVLVPGQGIVVLEVKSHSYIKYDERGWWLGNSPKPEARGPFKQASTAMHSIREYLKERGLGQRIPMVSAAVFTEAKFDAQTPEWHPWQVLDRQKLHGNSISFNIRKILENAVAHFEQSGYAWAKPKESATRFEMQRICAVLRPKFEIMANPSAKIKGLEESLYRCTQQQFRVLDLFKTNPRLLLSGLAGTGKTTLAVEGARRRKALNPDDRIALFCYNSLLGAKLAEEARTFSEEIRAGTFHKWMLQIADLPAQSYSRENHYFWAEELPDRVLENLTAPGVDPGVLDFLVIDEAQDLLTAKYLDIFNLILKGGIKSGSWLIVGDFHRQNIYAQGDIVIDSFIKEYTEERCTHFPLDQNCRNTQEISHTFTVVSKLSPAYSSVLREDTRHDPLFLFYDTRDKAEELCDETVTNYLSEGFKAKDIVLLSPFGKGATGRRLSVSPKWKNRMVPYELSGNHVRHSTIHRFKGLDSPVVVITDIEELDEQVKYDLLYIGMSRALHRLAVICHDKVKTSLREILL